MTIDIEKARKLFNDNRMDFKKYIKNFDYIQIENNNFDSFIFDERQIRDYYNNPSCENTFKSNIISPYFEKWELPVDELSIHPNSNISSISSNIKLDMLDIRNNTKIKEINCNILNLNCQNSELKHIGIDRKVSIGRLNATGSNLFSLNADVRQLLAENSNLEEISYESSFCEFAKIGNTPLRTWKHDVHELFVDAESDLERIHKGINIDILHLPENSRVKFDKNNFTNEPFYDEKIGISYNDDDSEKCFLSKNFMEKEALKKAYI